MSILRCSNAAVQWTMFDPASETLLFRAIFRLAQAPSAAKAARWSATSNHHLHSEVPTNMQQGAKGSSQELRTKSQ